MIHTLLVSLIAFSIPTVVFANTDQENTDLLQAPYFAGSDNSPSQIPFESQELVKSLFNYINSDGIDNICEEMNLEPIIFPSVLDLENATPGTLLILGSSETNIEVVVLCLGNGQCAQVSSMNGDTELETCNLLDLNLGTFPYQALFRKTDALSVDSSNSGNVNFAANSPSFLDISLDTFLDDNFDSYFVNEECLPYVLSPKSTEITLSSFTTWAEAHQVQLRNLIASQGAVLLRGFPIDGAEEFAEVVKSVIGRDLIDYKGEGSRRRIVRGVYTSTEAPPEFKIPLHNELSCTNNPIDYISFYCDIAPEPGTGQTLLGRTEGVTTEIMNRPAVWNLFDGKIIKYISRHPPENSFFTGVNPSHKSWPQAFETTDKDEVARVCAQKGYEFSWNGDWVEVIRRVPATRGPDQHFDHPYWFNQAYLYHANPRIRGGWVNHMLANLLYIMPSTRQYDIEFDNGTPIPQAVMYEIYDVLDDQTIRFNWEKNDVLLIDNHKTLHGRAPCIGNRRILTAMAQ